MDSPPQLGMTPLLRRQILENPECYPCWSGVTTTADYSAPKYTPSGGCDKRCCINPPITPAGEDTPGWAARVAAEEEEEAFQQPDFDAAADSPNNYSPSQATAEELAFFGRRMLRKMADQNPDDYTPEANLHHPDYGGDKYEASPPAKKHQPAFD